MSMENKKHKSALKEQLGIEQPPLLSTDSANKIQSYRKVVPTSDELMNGILNSNISELSRAITLIESTNVLHIEKANEIVNACLLHANKSVRIGITGVPGVGKSTFIEAFGMFLISIGKKVAVLAIDPSSSISKGSILGDKTRMDELVKEKNAYIRPSATGETLGGVARKTRETIALCEAAKHDVILVETVGVGQSETAVHSMVDFFLVLKIAGAGDELQGIKRGIMEMADAIVINKTDGDNINRSKLAKSEFGRALSFFPDKKSGWKPTIATCSAINNEGIESVWNTILEYIELTQNNNYFSENRKEQNKYWMLSTIEEQLKSRFYNDKFVLEMIENKSNEVQNDFISPFVAANQLLDIYFKK